MCRRSFPGQGSSLPAISLCRMHVQCSAASICENQSSGLVLPSPYARSCKVQCQRTYIHSCEDPKSGFCNLHHRNISIQDRGFHFRDPLRVLKARCTMWLVQRFVHWGLCGLDDGLQPATCFNGTAALLSFTGSGFSQKGHKQPNGLMFVAAGLLLRSLT